MTEVQPQQQRTFVSKAATRPTTVDRATYERQGFLVLPRLVLPLKLLDAADAAMNDVMYGEYALGVPPRGVGWCPGDDENKIRKIDEAHYADSRILELFCCEELAAWAAAITGADSRSGGFVQIYGTQLLVKPAGGEASGSIGIHQDVQYWRKQWTPGSQAFTITLALSDIDCNDGAISFFIGSHRWAGGDAHGVMPAQGGGDDSMPLGDFFSLDLAAHREAIAAVAAAQGEVLEEVVAALPRGGICFHDWKTMHGSGPNFNAGGQARRSFAIHCRTDLATRVAGSNDYHVSRLDDPAVAPVIFRADGRTSRRATAAEVAGGVGVEGVARL